MTQWSKSIPKQIVCDILKDEENSVKTYGVQQTKTQMGSHYQLLNQNNCILEHNKGYE